MGRRPTKLDSLKMLRRHGPAPSCVLDVGVQWGTPELRDIFPNRKHYLFEPVAEFHSAIARAYEGVAHEIVPAAVSHSAGETTLFTRAGQAGAEITHARIAHDRGPGARQGEHERRIETLTLDGFIAGRNLDGPFLLKIDVDGNEMNVLTGADAALRQCAYVVIEATMHAFAPRAEALWSAGFRLYDICDLLYYRGALHQADLVFVRKDIWRESALNRRKADPFDPDMFQKLS